jgi:hypothetical protein
MRNKFFDVVELKDMLSAKSNFAHFTSNYEIFIAGGSSKFNYALK